MYKASEKGFEKGFSAIKFFKPRYGKVVPHDYRTEHGTRAGEKCLQCFLVQVEPKACALHHLAWPWSVGEFLASPVFHCRRFESLVAAAVECNHRRPQLGCPIVVVAIVVIVIVVALFAAAQ